MERPLPAAAAADDDKERFHAISLSLVLNYVPSAAQRGEMLKRCSAFLATSLGYSKVKEKVTNKLIYQLWEFRPLPLDQTKNKRARIFRKEELNPGKTRNNFTITLNDNRES